MISRPWQLEPTWRWCLAAALYLGVLGALPSIAYGQGLKNAPSTVYSLTIKSNVADAVVMKDGLLLGKVGDPADVEVGRWSLLVSKPGFVTRKVVAEIREDQRQTELTVNLKKLPRRFRKNPPDMDFTDVAPYRGTVRLLAALPSFCKQMYLPPPNINSPLAGRCDRKNLFDDFRFTGWTWRRQLNPAGTAEQPRETETAQLIQELADDIGNAETDAWYLKAETLHARAPGDPDALNLLGFSALMRQECFRLFELTLEDKWHQANTSALHLFAAFCHELEGNYNAALKSLAKISDQSVPEAFYYAARAAPKKAAPPIITGLTRCIQEFPQYYPCYEALAAIHLRTKKVKSARRVIQAFMRTNGPALEKLFYKQLVVASASGDPDARLKLLDQAHKENPYAYEVAWEYMLERIRKTPNATVDQDEVNDFVGGAQIVVPDIAKETLKKVRDVKALRHSESAYLPFVAMYPKQPFYWTQLAQIKQREGQCQKAIHIVDYTLSIYRKPVRGLLTVKADCLLKMSRYEESVKIFRSLAKARPDQWKAQYNLAVALDAWGKKKEAASAFQESLRRGPPMDFEVKIHRRLEYLGFPVDPDGEDLPYVH